MKSIDSLLGYELFDATEHVSIVLVFFEKRTNYMPLLCMFVVAA